MASREEVKEAVRFMMLAYPNYHPDLTSQPNTIDVLFELLGDIDKDVLMDAVKSICKETGRIFAPSVGEIRGAMPKKSEYRTL